MRPGAARCLRWLGGLGGLALLLFPLAAPPGRLFDAPAQRVEKARARLVRHLAERRGLLHAITFDEPVPAEFLSGGRLYFRAPSPVPGHGRARKFDGRERTQIETPLRWDKIGRAFTLSFWVNVSPGRSDQCIWYRAAQGVQVGFHLEEGRMTFDVPSAAGRQSVYVSVRALRDVRALGGDGGCGPGIRGALREWPADGGKFRPKPGSAAGQPGVRQARLVREPRSFPGLGRRSDRVGPRPAEKEIRRLARAGAACCGPPVVRCATSSGASRRGGPGPCGPGRLPDGLAALTGPAAGNGWQSAGCLKSS